MLGTEGSPQQPPWVNFAVLSVQAALVEGAFFIIGLGWDRAINLNSNKANCHVIIFGCC